MRSFEELERLWSEGPPSPAASGAVQLLCVRGADGRHAVPRAVHVSPEEGVRGDRWSLGNHPDPDKQVTLIEARIARMVAHEVALDAAGDNFHVELALSEEALPAGTHLRLGTVLLRISEKPHTGCVKFRARFGHDALRWVAGAPRRRGVNCRVIEAGVVAIGDVARLVTAAET